MMDRDAPLVDVMSFLFVFALVVFVTSTDGSIDEPGIPPRLITVSIAPVQILATELSFSCAPTRSASDGQLRIALFSAGIEQSTPAATAFGQCIQSVGIEDRAVIFLSTQDDDLPRSLAFIITDIGDLNRINQTLDMEIRIEGRNLCQTRLHQLTLGKVAPLVIPLADDSNC